MRRTDTHKNNRLPRGPVLIGIIAIALASSTAAWLAAPGEPPVPPAVRNTVAREVALSGMDRGLNAIKIDGDDVMRSFGQRDPGGGTFDIAVSRNHYGDFDVSARGTLEQSRHEIRSNVIYEVPITAALVIAAPGLRVDTSGTYLISGRNSRMPSVASGAGHLPAVAGVAVESPRAKAAIDSAIAGESIPGRGGDGSVVVGVDRTILNDLFDQATISPGARALEPPYFGSFGRINDPAVLLVRGDFEPVGPFRGTGVLLVEDGSVRAGEEFRWEGVVMVRRTAPVVVDVMLSGNAAVFGSMILDDSAVADSTVMGFSMSGSSQIRYSAEAIAKLGSMIPSIERDIEIVAISQHDVELPGETSRVSAASLPG